MSAPKGGEQEDSPGTEEASSEMNIRRSAEVEESAHARIKVAIQEMRPEEFQVLVSALLQAMGYFIEFVSKPHRGDGGVDIVAYEDRLGMSGVRLKIQVKRYKDGNKPESRDVRELLSTLKSEEWDVGIFVCASDFPSTCYEEVNKEVRRLRLIDGNEFIRLWIEFYSKMPEEDRKRLPLYAVHFLDEEAISS